MSSMLGMEVLGMGKGMGSRLWSDTWGPASFGYVALGK